MNGIEDSSKLESYPVHEVGLTKLIPLWMFSNFHRSVSLQEICNDDSFDPLEFMLETSMKEGNTDLDFTETTETPTPVLTWFLQPSCANDFVVYVNLSTFMLQDCKMKNENTDSDVLFSRESIANVDGSSPSTSNEQLLSREIETEELDQSKNLNFWDSNVPECDLIF